MTRIVDINDSYSSATAPNVTTAGSTTEFLIKYANDGEFETANGVPPYSGKTGIYYNTTDNEVRFYNDDSSSWEAVGTGSGSGVGFQEKIGDGNGVTTNFSVTLLPNSTDSIIVYNDGLMIKNSDWSFSNPVITFNTPPPLYTEIYVYYLTGGTPSTPAIGVGTDRAVYHTVTAGEITAKQFTLVDAPADSTKVLVDIVGGVTQESGVDFQITGTTFDFDGYGLDGLLAENDIVRLYYII